MKHKKIVGVLALTLVLSGCTTLSDVLSQTSNPEDSSSGEINTGDSLTSIISSEVPVDSDLEAPNLSTFKDDISEDPANYYPAEEYVTKAPYNGYTYPSGVQVAPLASYLEFWHPETKLEMQIITSKEVLGMIEEYGVFNKRYADLYWPVTLDVKMNGKRFSYYEVGMRIKGNTSRKQFLDENQELNNGLSFKLSFNELFDDPLYAEFGLQKTWTEASHPEWLVRDDRTFLGNEAGKLGLKKIDLKWNKSKDPSLVMQPYAFGFFQKHGLISQNSTLTALKINNTRMGIVTINEPVDKHLLRRYFPKAAAAGDLYKVGWFTDKMGDLRYENITFKNDGTLDDRGIIGEENKYYYYEPGYDAKEFDDTAIIPHEKLINLMRVLKDNEGKSVSEASAALETVIDIPSFLKYAALSYLSGNPDDMRNWGNNYYIFFNPSENNKAYFIPYDYDWSYGLTWDLQNLSMLNTNPFTTKHELDRNVWQQNRLYWYTIIESSDIYRPYPNITMNSAYQTTYKNFLKEYVADSYYSVNQYNDLFNTYKANYNELSVSDIDHKNNHDGNNLGLVSPFLNTTLATNFITNYKDTVSRI